MKRILTIATVLSLSFSMSATADTWSFGSTDPSKASWSFQNQNLFSTPAQIQFSDYSAQFPWSANVPNLNREVLPACEKEIQTRCIESVEARVGQEGEWLKFTPGMELHAKPFSNMDNSNITAPPGAHFPRIWLSPSALATDGGNNYLVSAVVQYEGFHLSISPVQTDAPMVQFPRCPWSYIEVPCIRLFNPPLNAEFRITINAGDLIAKNSLWMFGRVSNPTIVISNTSGNSRLILSGSPMKIPVAQALLPAEEIVSLFNLKMENFNNPPLYTPILNFDVTQIDQYRMVLDKIGTQSIGEVYSWRFDSLGSTSSACFSNSNNGMGGIVSSNATVFSSFPPKWDPQNETLNYEVGAPHLLSNGEINTGEYRVILREDIAQCLWGVNASSARASVTILDDNGTKQAITAVSNLKNGYLYLTIAGFHYSASRISLKFEPQKSALVSPISAVSPKKILRKIICVKNGKTKTIQGIKPTCPTGYKEKKI